MGSVGEHGERGDTDYAPTMSEEVVAQIRRWHDRAYAEEGVDGAVDRTSDHLSPDGRMLIFFGTSGDLGYLRRLAEEEGFSTEVLAHDDLTREGWKIEYFTFRLSYPPPP